MNKNREHIVFNLPTLLGPLYIVGITPIIFYLYFKQELNTMFTFMKIAIGGFLTIVILMCIFNFIVNHFINIGRRKIIKERQMIQGYNLQLKESDAE